MLKALSLHMAGTWQIQATIAKENRLSLAFLAQAKSSTSISPIYGGTQRELQEGEASQVMRLAVD